MDILSVFIYLTTFALSLLCLFFSQKLLYGSKGNRNPLFGYLLLVVAIFIPCLLAALRGLSVGEDIGTYVLPVTDYSSDIINKGFFYFYENIPFENEIGFAYILYLGLIFDNIGLSFFIMQLLTIIPIYIVLVKCQKSLSVTLGFATYYLLNYNFSLSGMRVSIAMSLLLLMFYYLVNENKKITIIIIVLAFLFHNSAIIISLLFYVIYYLYKRGLNRTAIICLLLLFVGLFSILSKIQEIIFVLMNIVNPRYVNYLQEYMVDGGVFVTDFVSKSFIISLCTIILLRDLRKDAFLKLLLIMCIVGRCFVLLNTVFYESMRIAYYFDMFIILYSATAVNRFKSNSIDRLWGTTIVLVPSFFYWLFFIMITGAYGTNIYIFR